MDARSAAARLGVSRATLYAYVSRGQLRAHPGPGRGNRYRRSDVEALAAAHAAARQPRRVAAKTLDWGLPVLDSALTAIEHGHFHYRGHDAVTLAETATLDEVAMLLWTGRLSALPPPLPAPLTPGPTAALRAALRHSAGLAPAPGMAAALAWLLAHRPPPIERLDAAAALLRQMVVAVSRRALPARWHGRPLHEQLCRALELPPAAADLLRRALVLCADHELNASSFAVRCVAATGAGLGACVTAGLAALSGPRHGGMTARVETLWPWLQAALPAATLRRRLAAVIAQAQAQPRAQAPGREYSRYSAQIHRQLQQQQPQQQLPDQPPADPGPPRAAGSLLPGFGHPLYPDGDPRARALLALLPPDARRQRFIDQAQALCGQPPALDFALVALRHALQAPAALPYAVFALARSAGWIAHAIEQQDSGALIRPRARYVGPPSDAAAETPPAPPLGRVIRRR